MAFEQRLTRVTPRTPKVGLVLAFTGHYDAVRVLHRFLELMSMEVVTTRVTTPEILEAGTTLASADLCLPLRVYVGHVYRLLHRHPDIDFIVAPNVLSPDAKSSTCAKYRDIGGVAIRSLAGTVAYLGQHGNRSLQEELELFSAPDYGSQTRLPVFLMPNILTLDPVEIRNTCYDVYADIRGWPPLYKAQLWLPGARSGSRLAIEKAAERAYEEILSQRIDRVDKLLEAQERPRLGLVGRPYLVNDPLLTCDVKRWFERRGVAVVTARDVPQIQSGLDGIDGYYDSHKEGQAFIDWAHDKVDGFICLGCFGCHPDAFQVDYLADHARDLGSACWTFRFDESASQAGFHTRFETILAFLAQRRDERLARGHSYSRAERATRKPLPLVLSPRKSSPSRPLFIWPYMGEILNLCLEELAYQLGLQEYAYGPAPLSEQAMFLGSEDYSESCSPYAYSTGSLKHSLLKVAEALETRAAQGEDVPPHRILLIMLNGEGPCTFGWYSLVQRSAIPAEFAARFAAGGHTVEMATAGMNGVAEFLQQLSEAAASPRLAQLLEIVEKPQGVRHCTRLLKVLYDLVRPVLAKMQALERLRARSLVLRAHELEAGSGVDAYRQALELVRQEHTVRGIARAGRQGRQLIEAVPRDHDAKPRVVIVGEIYVALTSFANRGTVETLLAQEGIEVVEGITLSQFLRHSVHNIVRRILRNSRQVRPIVEWLRRRNLHILGEKIRDSYALPFLVHEVGGDGIPTVGAARRYVEAGCEGIVHVHPFKCMPEGIAKDAVKEIASLYGVRYLALSFDRETDIERLRTEVSTFAALLHGQSEGDHDQQKELRRRQRLGRLLNQSYRSYRRLRHTD